MPKFFSSFGKPTVLFVAELDDLSASLVKKLLQGTCKIFLLTKNVSAWKKISGGFVGNENLELIKEAEIVDIGRLDYFIYLYNFFRALSNGPPVTQKKIKKELLHISKKIVQFRTKNLMLLPAISGISLDTKPFPGRTIYFSETIGAHMAPDLKYFLYAALDAIVRGKRVFLPQNENYIRPAFSDSVAEKILEILFSLGYPHEITLAGDRILPGTFVGKISKGVFELEPKRKRYEVYNPLNTGPVISLGELTGIDETIDFLLTKQKRVPPKFKQKFLTFSRIITILVLLLCLPLATLLISAGFFGVSYGLVKRGDTSVARGALGVSRVLADASSLGFGILMKIPKAGKLFVLPVSASEILGRTAALSSRGLVLAENANSFLAKFLGQEPYKVADYSEELSSEIDYIYDESGFILGEIYAEPHLTNFFEGIELFHEVSQKREMLVSLSELSKNLPELLGDETPRKYLILLQNNMELRPTGGFIGSFALTHIEGGRLSNFEIWDVFEADGQLTGHVEPPLPIKLYLDEANWFLRDSNWDPDFGVSGARAEWFIDKEIDQRVDGVVGVDLEFVKSILELSGPVNIIDYGLEVNQDNFYEVTQKEVEEDFFPGSTKKPSFLTALSWVLVEKMKEVGSVKGLAFGARILKNLEERHIQIFAHEKTTRWALRKLGWDGRIPEIGGCGNNCYSDLLGIVEANVGVNKSNLFVERSISATVKLEEGRVKRELTLSLNNSSDKNLGKKGLYKVYVRVFGPQEASFQKVKIVQGGKANEIAPEVRNVRDYQEAGVLAFIAPQESVSLTFSWEGKSNVSLKIPGEYKLVFRKQAGTFADPFNLNISGDRESLTREGSFVYNTLLARDFVSRVSW